MALGHHLIAPWASLCSRRRFSFIAPGSIGVLTSCLVGYLITTARGLF